MVIWINHLWIPAGSARAARTGADLLPHRSTAQQRGMVGTHADGHQARPGGATGIPAHPKEHLTETWHCSGKESCSTKSDLGRKAKQPWNYSEQSQKAQWPTKTKSNMFQQETVQMCRIRGTKKKGVQLITDIFNLFLAVLWHELYRPQERECRDSVAFMW